MEFYNSILIWDLVFFFCNFNVLFVSGSDPSKLIFREYIGAESDSIKLSDVPINNNVEFHFILSFAIDYTNKQTNPSPTNGKFNIFWPTKNLGPTQIASFKNSHPNVKIAVSLGGDSVVSDQIKVFFAPVTIESWVQNAVSSLTSIIKEYNIDGIDIDYEHFRSDPDTFAECIGQVINKLKQNRTISFASIAPYEDTQSHYLALWRKYGNFFEYVDFQFYAFDKLNRDQFIKDFEEQGRNYRGGKLLASFESGGGGGLSPGNGFFDACIELKKEGKLGGIFIWCAEESVGHGFQYEKTAQAILSS